MSQEEIDVVIDQFRGVNERDFARVMDHYAEDVVLEIGSEVFLTAGTFKGKEAVGEWFGDWFRAFGVDYRFEITDARDLGGGLIFIHARYGGSGRASGAEVRGESAYLYRVKGGKVIRVQLFLTPKVALEAASLPEWSGAETD